MNIFTKKTSASVVLVSTLLLSGLCKANSGVNHNDFDDVEIIGSETHQEIFSDIAKYGEALKEKQGDTRNLTLLPLDTKNQFAMWMDKPINRDKYSEGTLLMIVHGTASSPARCWGGLGLSEETETSRALLEYAHTLSERTGKYVQPVFYQWPGGLGGGIIREAWLGVPGTVTEHRNAGNMLAAGTRIIMNSDPRLTSNVWIGHSHGCNAMRFGAQALQDDYGKTVNIDEAILIAAPGIEDVARGEYGFDNVKNVYSFYSSEDNVQLAGSMLTKSYAQRKLNPLLTRTKNAWNIRVLDNAESKGHSHFKACVLRDLDQVKNVVEDKYNHHFDLEANFVPGEEPMVAIRDEQLRRENNFVQSKAQALSAAQERMYSNTQKARFENRYGYDISDKGNIASRVAGQLGWAANLAQQKVAAAAQSLWSWIPSYTK